MSQDIKRLLESNTGHLHLMGIGGVGMAGLAFLLHKRGFRVTGCDRVETPFMRWLIAQGVSAHVGHDPGHVGSDLAGLVRSTAVPLDDPEINTALARGVPVYGRGETLAALLTSCSSVAVSGTHGKTTTTACITQILRQAGLDPSFFIGGEVGRLGGVAGQGKGPLVVEADESDGSLVHYHPDFAVITNVDYDHMEHFRTEEEFRECFRLFARQAKKRVICCADDAGTRRVIPPGAGALTYGLDSVAQVRARELDQRRDSSRFRLVMDGRDEGWMQLPVPGRHNVLNALAACAVASELKIPVDQIRAGLAGFAPVKRRFEVVAERDGILVVSDYAHHPTEIRALVQTARLRKPGRIMAVFQPHRYTRTLALKKEFPSAFEGVDELVLTPVYEASEKPLPGGTGRDLFQTIQQDGRVPVRSADSLKEAWEHIRSRLKKGDLFLIIGAGDVEQMAGWAKMDFGSAPRPD